MHKHTVLRAHHVASRFTKKMACFQAATLSLVVLSIAISAVVISTEAADAVVDAPSPAPSGPLNLTEILRKATQYNAFVRLLKDTEVTSQVTSLLDSDRNADGLTVLAPTDAAFGALKPGTLNRLDAQAQSQLVLFHILPKYYSFVSFETTTNPVRTQASSQHGVCTVNVTSGGEQQVNVSSGLIEATLGKPLYSAYPLAVYSVDKVLLLPEIFGRSAVKDGAEAPVAARKPQKQTPSATATGAAADEAPAKEADAKAEAGASTRTGLPAFAATITGVVLSLLTG
ncbi:fasciclin-like arabinogalactan protein 13 [Phragmites australis]|uniref:fasciclin-like arabinogalactan protein 13 n=1 Tax=Phragmites australis TaxID=29695 RepID=UPI002D77606E|nr:fasciclin-like arabinogalactan protein 13 [Phragmites australis]